MRDPYSVLGIAPDVSGEEIVAAYNRLLEAHGRGQNSGPQWHEVELAFDTLSDPAKRARYDAWMKEPVPAAAADVPPHDPSALSEPATVREPEPRAQSWNPVDRLTAGLPRNWRVTIDWVVTILGAIGIVLAIKAWVVNPYRIPSSSMEPTLHCARPGSGCLSHFSDRVLANRFIYHFHSPHRGDIIVFKTPPLAAERCGAGGTFVKRLIGLPGETWAERDGYVYINGKKLNESYVQPMRRDTQTQPPRKVKPGQYFMMGDNRSASCDSRAWGPITRQEIIGNVFFIYWPPNRISFVGAAAVLLGVLWFGGWRLRKALLNRFRYDSGRS